jgi:hypothetical protein
MHFHSASYRLSVIDVFHLATRNTLRNGFLWAVSIFMSLYHLWNVFRAGDAPTLTAAAITFGTTLALIWVGILIVLPGFAILRNWPSLGHEVVVSAEADRLTIETPQSRRDVEWNSILDIRVGRSRTRFTLASGPPFFLPRRAFDSPENLVSFLRFCRNRIGAPPSRSA